MRSESKRATGVKGAAVHRVAWLPDADARDAVVIAHGYAEHSGRYAHVAEALVADGLAVHALDHRGHGRSEGPRVNVEDFRHYLSDLDALVDEVRLRHVGRTFLLGHSLGGLIAASYAAERQGKLDGLVLSGASVKPVRVSPVLNAVARTLARVAPGAPVVKLPLDKISRDPEVVARYQADPLVFDRPMAARQAREAVDAQARLAGRVGSITLPVLIMHGTADGLVSVADSEWFFERVGSADKTLKLYDGLYHEIFNEPEKERVLADLREWLRAHR